MSTTKSQRIGIWVIAVVLTVGTIGSFFVVILANKNNQADQAALQKQYQKQLDDYKKLQEEAKKANKPLDGYSATPFDKNSVTKLKVETLKEGTGAVVKADSTITANYFGWTSDGSIFDSTNKNDKVTPIDFSLTGVIKGWTNGLTGAKVGSTVRLTIPADQAYGSKDDGSGRPVGPLMFVVEIQALK
ncbi:MAG: FKBP-type peptidyl-prolyl cis-trans isomerase [Candidatus Nomurabacteria bacterium]|nr:MAG: FKBP-type peptidyl-prolyl cis-trans isomerase [Candidatus Nomurabacteria bacterium]